LGPDGICTISIRAFSDEQETIATVEIPYQVDRFLPEFTQNQYGKYLENPAYPGTIQTILTIQAKDGDLDINTTIWYSIPEQPVNCKNCFEIDNETGEISWVQSIPTDTIKEKKVDLTIMVMFSF
jgi:hypothetical protein